MNESQTSCRDLYNCSCPEIDELTEIAKKNGAYGSRLTGAGWGGCTVSLIAETETEKFIETMKKEYYSKPELKERIEKNGISNVVFATQPCEGAFVIIV